jgi:hypothetical protein
MEQMPKRKTYVIRNDTNKEAELYIMACIEEPSS